MKSIEILKRKVSDMDVAQAAATGPRCIDSIFVNLAVSDTFLVFIGQALKLRLRQEAAQEANIGNWDPPCRL